MQATIDDYKCPKCGSFLRVLHQRQGWFCTFCKIEFEPGKLEASVKVSPRKEEELVKVTASASKGEFRQDME